jgi:hypothetical protein
MESDLQSLLNFLTSLKDGNYKSQDEIKKSLKNTKIIYRRPTYHWFDSNFITNWIDYTKYNLRHVPKSLFDEDYLELFNSFIKYLLKVIHSADISDNLKATMFLFNNFIRRPSIESNRRYDLYQYLAYKVHSNNDYLIKKIDDIIEQKEEKDPNVFYFSKNIEYTVRNGRLFEFYNKKFLPILKDMPSSKVNINSEYLEERNVIQRLYVRYSSFYNEEDTFGNLYKETINSFLISEEFQTLMNTILCSEVIKSYYQMESIKKFTPDDGYRYLIPDKLDHFWGCIRLTQLPDKLSSYTTHSLNILINTIPREIENTYNIDNEREWINVFIKTVLVYILINESYNLNRLLLHAETNRKVFLKLGKHKTGYIKFSKAFMKVLFGKDYKYLNCYHVVYILNLKNWKKDNFKRYCKMPNTYDGWRMIPLIWFNYEKDVTSWCGTGALARHRQQREVKEKVEKFMKKQKLNKL